ncbi:DUF7344 domain-containing protein [Salinilacihabitans rarus]|uniref:DUF7344 domain-containing protein n=1 Tax=Salinilacihabitans rarus TaxID=2961596 RepID=UPI0020C8E551|nr:hypothetical protein [Salinilacihabitans rarus]
MPDDRRRRRTNAGPGEDGNGDESEDEDGLDDDVFRVLRNRDRRYALYFLLEHGTVALDELADVVVGWTNATTYGTASKRLRDGVYVDLTHRHLPAMADVGVVRYDHESGEVSLSCSGTVREFVRLACEAETGPEGRP